MHAGLGVGGIEDGWGKPSAGVAVYAGVVDEHGTGNIVGEARGVAGGQREAMKRYGCADRGRCS